MNRIVIPSNYAVLVAAALLVGPASAAVTVVQQAGPAPTYATTLNFDEAGGPTGNNVPGASWTGIGITSFVSGEGNNSVSNQSGTFPWLPSNNVYWGPFGVFMNFSNDLSAISFQAWDTSGPPSPFGGGMGVILLNNGVEVGGQVFNPAWGGVGNTWYHVTTTAGSSFDEVRVVGFGFPAESFVDNISWNAVPGPGSLALLGLAGLVGKRRRRG
jgi:MYXO-CTERM domain-containing protein